MKLLRISLLLASLLVAASTPAAYATIVWNWSFASESGQFVTTGLTATPGNFTLTDFSVSSSASGGTIGSLSGGQYFTPVFLTNLPFSFDWDGSRVTSWLHSGINSFDWWAFGEVAGWPQDSYFFGWDTGNINDPRMGAHFNGDMENPLAVGEVTVSAANSSVPEPSTFALLGGALVALAARRSGLIKARK